MKRLKNFLVKPKTTTKTTETATTTAPALVNFEPPMTVANTELWVPAKETFGSTTPTQLFASNQIEPLSSLIMSLSCDFDPVPLQAQKCHWQSDLRPICGIERALAPDVRPPLLSDDENDDDESNDETDYADQKVGTVRGLRERWARGECSDFDSDSESEVESEIGDSMNSDSGVNSHDDKPSSSLPMMADSDFAAAPATTARGSSSGVRRRSRRFHIRRSMMSSCLTMRHASEDRMREYLRASAMASAAAVASAVDKSGTGDAISSKITAATMSPPLSSQASVNDEEDSDSEPLTVARAARRSQLLAEASTPPSKEQPLREHFSVDARVVRRIEIAESKRRVAAATALARKSTSLWCISEQEQSGISGVAAAENEFDINRDADDISDDDRSIISSVYPNRSGKRRQRRQWGRSTASSTAISVK